MVPNSLFLGFLMQNLLSQAFNTHFCFFDRIGMP